MIVLHNTKRGNNYLVAGEIARHFNCDYVAAEDSPFLEHDLIIIVVSNWGDEELPQPMEDYLCSLTARNKKYVICELGNHFGFEYNGCGRVADGILGALGWRKVGGVSLDSVPAVAGLVDWLKNFPCDAGD